MTEAGDVFRPSVILGSGPSILDLTPGQKELLSRSPFVFGMNKYLMFWDVVGVHPSHFFLFDHHFPAYAVLQKSVERAPELRRYPLFCLRNSYRPFVNKGSLGKRLHRRKLEHIASNDHGFEARFLDIERVMYYWSTDSLFAKLRWADSLWQKLYYYRGSLSVLMNLATILNPRQPIYLLGVDMNTPLAFYQEQLDAMPMLRDRFHARGEQSGKHPTVVEHQLKDGRSVPGILERWPFLRESCEARGCPIYNVNPESLLVQEGLAEHRPLPGSPETG